MRIHGAIAMLAAALGTTVPGARAQQPATTTQQVAAWCAVTYPTGMVVGKTAPVEVRVTGVPAEHKVAADLHWLKADGAWGGMNSWGGGAKPVPADGVLQFRFRPQSKPGMGALQVMVYTTATDDWAGRKLDVRTGRIPVSEPGRPIPDATFRKSWIRIDPAASARTLTEGEEWVVPVEYGLDPSEDDSQTTLRLMVMGPWIDCPDGTYTTNRHHVGYGGLGGTQPVKAGRDRLLFRMKAPRAKERNGLLLIAAFQRATGARWPWEVRARGPWLRRAGGFFELETDVPGNLFTYDEPVVLHARLKQAAGADPARRLAYRVLDGTGAEVAQGEVPLAGRAAGERVAVPLSLERRGIFLFKAEVSGWEARHATFARIPDVVAATRGEPTRFGLTNILGPGEPERTEALCRIARRLGLTTCRQFVSWEDLEPARGEYRLEPWDEPMAIARRAGVTPWFCLVGPPAWAQLDAPVNVGYRTFRGDTEAWAALVRRVGERYRGTLFGWEWLNEITPGGSERFVDDYLALVKAGTAAARAADPASRQQLAGGLWPRTFRQAVLKAGAGEHVDILPVHYSRGGAVREAYEDLAAAGAGRVEVWDNETARGLSTWGAPPEFDLKHRLQSNWILSNWADELAAGCRRMIYFGGTPDPAGNWSFLHDDLTPRPVAATLAVFAAKLHGAEPLGAFALGEGGVFHLFARGGEAVLLASSYREGERIPLRVGSGAREVAVTDGQGNPRPLAAPGGVATLDLGRERVYVEGADLETLKTYVVAEVLVRRAAQAGSGALKDTVVLAETPRTTMVRGLANPLAARVRNLYARPLRGRVTWTAPAGWGIEGPDAFDLAPGATAVLPVRVTVPEAEAGGDRVRLVATFRFDDARLPAAEKPLDVTPIRREALGSLLANGDFERPAAAGDAADGWSGNAKRVAADPGTLGLGRFALRFDDTKGQWAHHSQRVVPVAGQTYLYTAWVWNRGMKAGSNIGLHLKDGTTRNLFDVHVFTCGEDNPWWQLYTARVAVPPDAVGLSATPVARGEGWAMYDEVRLTLYEGSDYAAEAFRAAAAPAIDGRLDDWDGRCPVPLLGRNQITVLREGYAASPTNLHGVAWLRWDDANLYFAARLRDDRHVATAAGAEAHEGDGLLLAFDPARGPDTRARAFVYHVSAAAPGGGSGRHTLYRPPGRAGGLASGQLARDSSVYDLAVVREGTDTVYELRMPLAELGLPGAGVGTKFGFSLDAADDDGEGSAGALSWGEGVRPAWAPERLGVVTLVE